MDLYPTLVVAAAARCSRARALRAAALGALLLLGVVPPASAQTILDAFYSRSQDELVVEIAYQGTNPNHDFSIVWDACQKAGGGQAVVGRLIDGQGNDVAQKEFKVRRRFSLADLPCRPAEVTVRLGPVSNRSVPVPAAGR